MSNTDGKAIARGRDRARQLDPAVRPVTPPPAPNVGLRLLAMGDSWFSYFPPFDVLVALQNKYGYAVDSVAVAGASLAEMTPPGKQLDDLLKIIKKLSPGAREATKAILLSGGLIDVVAKLASLLNPASSGLQAVNDAAVKQAIDTDLRSVLAEVLSAITQISELHIGRVVPILIHGYAHPVPDGRCAKPGPCLQPVLRNKGYADLQAGADIMSKLIDRLNLMQMQLLADNAVDFAHVTHVDLRPALNNTLAGDAYKVSWQKEMDPTIPAGFISVADKLEAALRNLRP